LAAQRPGAERYPGESIIGGKLSLTEKVVSKLGTRDKLIIMLRRYLKNKKIIADCWRLKAKS
jgi:hypothetical protein